QLVALEGFFTMTADPNSTMTISPIRSDHSRRMREAAEVLFKPKARQPAPAGATTLAAAVAPVPGTAAGLMAQPAPVVSEPAKFAGATAQPPTIASEPGPLAGTTAQLAAIVSEPGTR